MFQDGIIAQEDKTKKLIDLKPGEKAIITKIKGIGAFRKRILEMGFVVGRQIESVKKAPFHDPVEYKLMGYNVSLRNTEAELIEVVSEADLLGSVRNNYNGTIEEELFVESFKKKKTISVAFVGNPNSGKTTIFNSASHSREKVGNYGGVTVDLKEAKFNYKGYTFNLVDLPGTYSITAYSNEELYVRDYIFHNTPDIVVNVVDASNLERNLYLTTQLIDMDLKVVTALNMYDEMEEKGDEFDYDMLGKMIGVPFVPTVASKGKGIKELFERIIEIYHDRDETVRHVHINYGTTIENAIKKLRKLIDIPENNYFKGRLSSRFLAIKLLEQDKAARETAERCHNTMEILEKTDKEINRIESEFREDSESVLTDARYGFIEGALKETLQPGNKQVTSQSEKIDKLLTHKYLGIPLFLFFMWLTFYVTFNVGEYPMSWIETGVGFLSAQVDILLADGIVKDFVTDGILGGVGGVIVFLPNIVLLYLFISLMEDSGYMARAVFIMDRAMHKMGLHGKSFIPLLMGFGCNVPAILSSRIIESKRDRMLTILVNPFMSCSARLTVYVLLISAFFVTYQSLVLFSLYIIGIFLAIFSAWLFRKTMFKKKDIPFVMELPPYRFPTFRTVMRHMWFRASQYLKKVGGVILVASMIIWALGYFPRNIELSKDYTGMIQQTKQKYAALLADASGAEASRLMQEKEEIVNQLQLARHSEKQQKSYIGRIGNFMGPVMEPLGFDWRMSVSILTGVAAKEVVVGTIGVLYQADESADENSTSLINKLQQAKYQHGEKKGQKVFTPLVAFSFMLFILIYFPCVGVVAAIKKESGAWKWSAFSTVYSTVLAWLIAFAAYQIGSLF